MFSIKCQKKYVLYVYFSIVVDCQPGDGGGSLETPLDEKYNTVEECIAAVKEKHPFAEGKSKYQFSISPLDGNHIKVS